LFGHQRLKLCIYEEQHLAVTQFGKL